MKFDVYDMQQMFFFSLCSPVLAPQIVGGEGPDGFVTLKESTRHWPPFERLIVPSWVNIY